jgi:murein DD-endopeptidase MepM/ murein hydrolase activator NlpD
VLPLPIGCASPRSDGFYYTVQPGENLYRIGRRFGVSTEALVRANRIRDVTEVPAGARIWIPRSKNSLRRAPSASERQARLSEARNRARADARRAGKLEFRWPMRGGKLTSRFGRRNGRPHEGIDLAASRGTAIRAAEAGKVIHSGGLGAYGRVVIVKHSGYYRSVYAHARRTLVRKGQFVERGQKIAEVGSTGNASGPHLHFEIRRGQTARDPMLYLP